MERLMKLGPLNIRAAGISAVLFAVVLNGCTNTGSQFTSAAVSTPQNIATANVDQLIRHHEPKAPYESVCFASWPPAQICWLKENGDIICWTAYYNYPHGITGDKSGKTFYVGEGNDTVAVLRYAKGNWTQVATIGDLIGVPDGMATDSHRNLWVTNTPTTTITEFAYGTNTPIATYTDGDLNSVNYLAIDTHDNVYVEGSAGSAMEIDELTASATFTVIGKPGQVGTTPGGLAIQPHGKKKTYMWVNDQGSGSGSGTISRYLLKDGSLKSTGSFRYSGFDGAIAVDPSGKDTDEVYATNSALMSGYQFNGTTVEYTFPSGQVTDSWGSYTLPYENVSVAVLNKL
jgi:hypothetical protein